MIGIYALILTVAALAAYGIYELYQWKMRQDTKAELAGPGEDNRNLKQIIRVVYNQAQMGGDKAITRTQVSKVLLMEDLDLRPKELKRYLGILSKRNLIKETLDYVTITPFGVQFYQVFQDGKLNLS